jgi:bifunctional non-homologous end joining protein LigD
LLERKAALRKLLTDSRLSRVFYSDHITGQGREFFSAACAHGLEGIVSKPLNESYRAGHRDRWLKIKCIKRQEFVVGGWLPSGGSGRDLGALLVGYFDSGKFEFAGRVGTGFNTRTRRAFLRSLTAMKRDTDPFEESPRELGKQARWTEPRTVVEVGFTEFTNEGLLRHPTFKGIREDKSKSRRKSA